MKKIVERLLAVLQQPSQRRRLIKIGSVLAVLALAWTLIVGWWLPGFLQPRIEAAASEALGAPLKMERLEISPWELEARVLGLRLGPEGAPWLRLAELRADVSSESLWRLAPVLARLQLREPRIELERIDTKHYNITPMLEALAKRPPAPPGSQPARFAVHNIRLEGGRVHVVDRVSKTEHLIDALQLGIPFISNLPYRVEQYVVPSFSAKVAGTPVALNGRSRPFANAPEQIAAF